MRTKPTKQQLDIAEARLEEILASDNKISEILCACNHSGVHGCHNPKREGIDGWLPPCRAKGVYLVKHYKGYSTNTVAGHVSLCKQCATAIFTCKGGCGFGGKDIHSTIELDCDCHG